MDVRQGGWHLGQDDALVHGKNMRGAAAAITKERGSLTCPYPRASPSPPLQKARL